MDSQALLYVILLGILWGSNLVVVRFGLGQFNPVQFVGLRLLLASLAHVAVYLVDRRRQWPTDRRLWGHGLLMGTLGTAVPMVSTISALEYLSSGMTAVFVTTAPAVTVLLAHFFLPDESLDRRKGLGVLLALGGALLLALSGESGLPDVSQASPVGALLVLIGILFGSAMAIYARRYLRDYNAFDVATVRVFIATLAVNLLVAVFIGYDLSGVDGRGYLTLVYAALFGAFAGLVLEYWIVHHFGATAAAMTAYVIPIAATLGGTLFLGEQVTGRMLIGMALIILGIAILHRRYPVKEEIIPPLS